MDEKNIDILYENLIGKFGEEALGTRQQFGQLVKNDESRAILYENLNKELGNEATGTKEQFDRFLGAKSKKPLTAAESIAQEQRERLLGQTDQDTEEPVDAKPVQEPGQEQDVANLGILEGTMVGDFVEDIYRGARRGLASGAGVFNSLQVLARGANATDEDLTQLVESTQKQEKYGMSDEFRNFIEAKGFKESWNAFWNNPITITAEIVTESAFALARAGGGAIAGSALTGPAAIALTPLALGSTSAALETSGKMVEGMQEILAEKGLEFNKDNLREVFRDEAAWEDLRNRAIAKGAVIGLVDAATAGIVSKIGGSGLVSKLTAKAKAGEKITDAAVRATKRGTVLKQAVTELPAGGVGELGGQLAAGEDLDFKSAFLEVLGEIPGGAASIGSSHIINKKRMGNLTVNEMANAVQNVDQNTYNAAVDVAQQLGQINETQATELKDAYQELSEMDKTVPARVRSKNVRAKILGKINQRNEIQEEIERINSENVDEAFEDEKKAALDALAQEKESVNNDIKDLSNAEETGQVREQGVQEEGGQERMGNMQSVTEEVETEEVKPDDRDGKQHTEFFTGKAGRASSQIPYVPVIEIDQSTPVGKAYEEFSAGGNFTGHISKMIPGFAEKQKQVAEAIVAGDFDSFLDIGTSEGGMIKTVSSVKPSVKSVGIDPNSQMRENFESTPDVPNAEFRQEAYQASWTDDDGTVINEFKPNQKFDVINEDFAFQFMNNNRKKQVKGVKDMLTEDGIFITSEKFHTANKESNEKKKLDHQRQYFNKEEITEDQQTIITGMADDMVNDVEYFNILKDNFKHVREFWNAGEFKGYLASDNLGVLEKFQNDIGNLDTEFTDTQSQTTDRQIDEIVAEPTRRTIQDMEDRLGEIEPSQKTTDEIELDLSEGKFGIVSAENPNRAPTRNSVNNVRNNTAKAWLQERGYNPIDVVGRYENIEYSFYVPGLTFNHAQEFAQEFNQDAVATDEGLVYQDGSMNPRNKEADTFDIEIGPETDNYSIVRANDADLVFSIGYDFDTTLDAPAEPTPSDQLKDLGAERRQLENKMNEEAGKLESAAAVALKQSRRGLRLTESSRIQRDYDKSALARLLDTFEGEPSQVAKAIGQGVQRLVVPQRMRAALEEQLGEKVSAFAARLRAMEERRVEIARQEAEIRNQMAKVDSSLPLRMKVEDTTYQLREEEGRPVYRNKEGKAPSKDQSRDILERMVPAMAVRAQRTKGITSKELQAQIERVKRALSNLVPTLKIGVLSNEDFALATNQDPNETSRGSVRGNMILINGDKANALTVPHEAAHMVMIQLVGTNSPGATIIHNTLAKALRRKGSTPKEKALAAELDSFITNYENSEGGTDVRAHEFFAELTAFLSENKSTLSKDSITKQVVKAINDLLDSLIGIRPLNDQAGIDAIIDFTNTISDSLAEGREIKEDITPDFIRDTKIENDVTDAEFNQAVEVFDGVLEKLGINIEKKRGRVTNRAVAEALHQYYTDNFETTTPTDFSEEARQKYVGYGVDEFLFAISRWKDASGMGWYTTDFQAALDMLAELAPSINTPEGRAAATVMTAVTSAAEAVEGNFRAVPGLVKSWEATGRFDPKMGVKPNIRTSIKKVNTLLDKFNGDIKAVERYLLEEVPVSQAREQTEADGVAANAGWPGYVKADSVDMVLPRSVAVFGPKIGAFYANLSGVSGLPTIDRWFVRTAFRYSGDTRTIARPKDVSKFKKANGLENVSDASALSLAEEHSKIFKAILGNKELSKAERNEMLKPYRLGHTIAEENKGIVAGVERPMTAPQQRAFRGFWKSVMEGIQDRVAEQTGMTPNVSDIQAVLWLLEKRLYGYLGASQRPKDTYSQVANQMLAETDIAIEAPLRTVTDDTPQGEIHHSELQDVISGVENRAFDQLAEDVTGIDDMIRDMHNALPNLSIAEKVQLLNAGGVNITEQQFKNIINGTKTQKAQPVQKAPQVRQRRVRKQNTQDDKIAPGELKAVNEVVREIRQGLFTRQSLVGKLIGKTTIDSIFREAARDHISKDGSGTKESKIAYMVMQDGKIPSAAEEVALAYRAMKLQEARRLQNSIHEKAVANNSPKADTYLDQLSATEAELEHVLKAIEIAGSRTGLALRIRQEILTFDRFSEAGILSQMSKRKKGTDLNITKEDKAYARDKSIQIANKEAELKALEDKKLQKSEDVKEDLAALQVENLKDIESKRKAARKKGKVKSVKDAKAAYVKFRKNYDC